MMSNFKGLLILTLLALTLTGQDLNTAWQAYLSTNSNIAELEAERAAYTREQVELKSEVAQLQKGSDWYNAWINKYLLSGRSKRQLVILDSLRTIDAELERLHILQKDEIKALQLAYTEVLEYYEKEGVLPVDQRTTSLQVGRWMTSSRPTPILFPDYTEVLDIEWHNPQQHQLILRDIQRLLQAKIMELDSLQEVREAEAELALRLADFHEDLGLQMEADQDAQQRDASGNSERLSGWYMADATNQFAEVGGGLDMPSSKTAETMDLVSINVPREDGRELSLDQRSGNDLNFLKKKLTEYKTLLAQITQELNQVP